MPELVRAVAVQSGSNEVRCAQWASCSRVRPDVMPYTVVQVVSFAPHGDLMVAGTAEAAAAAAAAAGGGGGLRAVQQEKPSRGLVATATAAAAAAAVAAAAGAAAADDGATAVAAAGAEVAEPRNPQQQQQQQHAAWQQPGPPQRPQPEPSFESASSPLSSETAVLSRGLRIKVGRGIAGSLPFQDWRGPAERVSQ
jgi:hypothetical protein